MFMKKLKEPYKFMSRHQGFFVCLVVCVCMHMCADQLCTCVKLHVYIFVCTLEASGQPSLSSDATHLV